MGEKLLKDVAAATGLPSEIVSDELMDLVHSAGKNPAELTLEDLRQILADYVQDVLLAAKEEFSREENGD